MPQLYTTSPSRFTSPTTGVEDPPAAASRAALQRANQSLLASVHLTSAWPKAGPSKDFEKEVAIASQGPRGAQVAKALRMKLEGHDLLRSALVTPAGQRTRSQDALVAIATRVADESKPPTLPGDPDATSAALQDVLRLSREAFGTTDAPSQTYQAITLLLEKWGSEDPAMDSLLNGGPVLEATALHIDDAMTLRAEMVRERASRIHALQAAGGQQRDDFSATPAVPVKDPRLLGAERPTGTEAVEDAQRALARRGQGLYGT